MPLCLAAVLVALAGSRQTSLAPARLPDEPPLSQADRDYLTQLGKDTWHCISRMVQPTTGLPYDNVSHGEWTSVSNIGIYLSSVCAAREMGWISPQAADLRLRTALESLDQFKTWFGFQQSWNSVDSLLPAKHDPMISVLDSGNLAAGLITVAEAAPHERALSLKIFNRLQWDHFYDPASGAMLGGYNTTTSEMNMKWRLDLLSSDAMLAQFFDVAKGNVPPSTWDALNRGLETKEGVAYFVPGWQGGGYFMQTISGLWLDLRGSVMGTSAANFAYAQWLHAKAINAPVWGWSASDSPKDGYLGWGHIKDEVVTPHACVLAIQYLPNEAVANLRRLEALGVRSPEDGFYDAVDWTTKNHSSNMLMLDQGMLLLSLFNYLHNDQLRTWFQANEVVKAGRGRLSVFASQ